MPDPQQYSDLPPGAVVVGGTPPPAQQATPAFSDLPDGAQVLGPPAPQPPRPLPNMAQVPGVVPGTPSPTDVPRPPVPRGLQPTPTLPPYDVTKAVVGGLTDVAAPGTMMPGKIETSPGEMTGQGARELLTPGKRVTGALRTGAGVLEAGAPLAGPMAVESPGKFVQAGVEGYLAGKAGKKVAKAAGGTEEQQALAEDIGQMAPILAHAMMHPEIAQGHTPEGNPVVQGTVRGKYGAGVEITPDEFVVRGGTAENPKEMRIPRRPKAAQPAAVEPPTVEQTPQYSDIPPGAKVVDESGLTKGPVPERFTPLTPEGKPVHHTSNDVEDLRASAERQSEKIGDAVAKATEGVEGAKVEAVRDSKDSDRITDKAERQGIQPSQVGDIAGAKVTVPHQEAANQVLQNLHQEMPVESVNGQVTGEPGKNAVRQTQAIVTTGAPAGEPVKKAEVMIQTPEMAEVTERTHDQYRKAQELRAAGKEAEAKAIEDQISREHEAAEQAARARQGESNVRERSTEGVVQRQPEEAGISGRERGRVEPGEQGQGTAATSAQAPGEKENLRNQKVEVRGPDGQWHAGTVEYDNLSGPGPRRLRGMLDSGHKFDNVKVQDVRKPASKKPDVGIDFDGTLFTENPDGSIGQPIPERIASLKQMLADGKNVVIETRRVKGRPEEIKKIQDALEAAGLPRLPVTDEKAAPILIDDSVRQVESNANTPLPNVGGANDRQTAQARGEVAKGPASAETPQAANRPAGDTSTPAPAQTERRTNLAERKRVSEMSHEERGRELLTSHVVDLPNRRAFDEAGKSQAVAMSDADGLKALNDKFGYEAGNELLRAKAEALKEAGLDAYHDKGDEFLYRGANLEELNSKLEKAREILRNRVIEVQMNDGSVRRFKGADFSYGAGTDTTQAEAGLKAHKSDREARGERARGELRGIAEVGSEKGEVGQGAAEKEHKYKHGNTQAPIPATSEAGQALKTARDRIADSDTAGKGKETDPHVTVRYGIKGDDTSKIREFLSQQSPFEATLGKTESFPPSEHSDGAAVIMAPIEAPELHRLNSEIQKHGEFAESNFKSFVPHATISYVKPEKASRYVGMTVTEGKKFTVDTIYITDRDGNAEAVQLRGAQNEKTTNAIGTGSTRSRVPDRSNESSAAAGTAKEAHNGEVVSAQEARAQSPQNEIGKSTTSVAERPSGSAPVPPKPFEKGEFVYHEGRRVRVEGQHTLISVPLRQGGARTETTMVDVRDQQGGIRAVKASELSREPQEKTPRPVTPQIIPEKKPAPGPTLKEGDRVSWEARGAEGKGRLTGKIRSIDEMSKTASVDTDQVRLIGNRIPIGRVETVPLERLQWEGSPEQKPSAVEERTPELFHAIGQDAFDAGLKRVPAHDPKLMDFLKGADAATTNRALGEWLKGWDEANLAAPVDTGRTLEGEKPSGKAEDQPARPPSGPEEISGVPGAPRQGGAARTPVPTEGVRSPEGERETGRGTGQPDRGSLERPSGPEGEGRQPARSGGNRIAKHPTPEREGGGTSPTGSTGADGRRIEAPTPEEPEEARTTAAELRNQRNFHISDEEAQAIGAGGEKSKIRGNLDALETFKKIQAEGRELATPEEQATIAKYVDFGGLVGMLQNPYAYEYREHTERFNKLLTQAEQQEIRETLPNTHYTSMQMVDWAWKALGRLGFKGGRWLEPGMGIGNFVGRMPEKIGNRSEVYGVERNPLTGGMAKLLYPDAKIQVKPFQQFIVPNNSFDASIGNVPFQDVTINDDPAYRDLKLNLHNYFIVKTLDKIKPGGIAALITSRYTLDSAKGSGYRAREEMAKRADLIAAIRLPNSAFKGNARTEVVADLLIFQKRDPNQAIEKMPDWTATVQHKVGDQTYTLNKYIVENPDHVLGEHSDKGSMYRDNEYTVKPPADFTAALDKAMDLLPRNVFGKIGKVKTADISVPPSTLEPGGIQFAPEDVKPGAFFRDDKGQIKIKESGVAKDLPEGMRSKAAQEHLGAAIDLRDQVNRTLAIQLESSDDAPLKAAQAELEKLYKSYVKKYGNTHSPLLAKIFKHDPEYGKLLALENVDTESKEVTKSSIFTKRTLAPFEPLRDLPDEPKSAMLKVMAERGYLDTALMADLLKKPESEVVKNLEKEGLIYQDPQTGAHHPADEYLSGNVREKLKQAELARETDPRFDRNVEALKKVQPKPLTIHEIQPNLGQTWIPMKIYKGFIAHLAGAGSRGVSVDISRDTTGRWLVRAEGNKFKLEHEWQGGGIPGHKLVQYALNQQQPTVYDTDSDGTRHFNAQDTTAARDKLAMIKEEFTTVLRKARQEVIDNLEQIYNDTFNGYKLREFNGEHLDFPGMSEDWRGMIRGYQKAAVWRLLQEGRGGIFHAPGLGKTLTMAATGMEARRLKLSRKNMYAVPNHMVPQWREDFKRFYPNANVLAVTDEDFTPVNRAQLMSRIATGDWDAVIVPHSQFDLLPMSPEWEKKSIDKRLADYREVLSELDEENDRRTIKQIEKAIDKLESRLQELNAKKKDNTISFDQMGVDMLFVDEAHAYKSMAVPTKMGNIGGISNSASQRAFALEMKANYLRDTHKGRGLVFGTGTPITNTVGELYVMTKYLAPEMLEAAGIRSFDDWAANFAQTVTTWEYAPDGVTFKPKTTLSEFVNVPELSTMFRRYAEYLSKEAARALSNLKEPNAKRQDHMVQITGAQEPLLDMVAQRGDHLIKNPPKTREERMEDNWLKLSGDARKISLDARLYDPDLPDEPTSKANQAVKVIKDILDRTASEKGTVAVFSDFFQHKDKAGKPDFNLFEDMKKKLIAQGVPASEIAIIHDVGDDKNKKELLFARVRSGKVRVIFGSTDKMGIGTNIQARLKGELHLDQPWRPDQVEQREGRIVRSGNMWDDVEIHRFIAEPKEGTVQKYKSDAMTPSARILGKDEAPYDYERVLDLPDDRKLAYKSKDYTEEDAKAAVEAGNLQKMLDSTSAGGIVETARPRAYDLQMYQQLARKANFQEQFLTGNYTGRTMEDVGGDVKLNSQMFQLGKAMATGNPDALRKMKVEHDLRTYSMLERNFQVERSKAQREQANAEYRIPLLEKKVKKLQTDVDTWKRATAGEDEKDWPGLKVTIGNKTLQGKEGPNSLKEWIDSEPPISSLVDEPITIGGLPTTIESRETLYAHGNSKNYEKTTLFEYSLAGEKFDVPYDEEKRVSHVRAFINSFSARARGLESRINNIKYDIESAQEKIASLAEDLKRTSPYTAKVEAMEKELAELNTRLGIHGPAQQDEGAAPSDEPEGTAKPANKSDKSENLITGESGQATPRNIAYAPARIKKAYDDLIEEFISGKLKIGDKYYDVAKADSEIAHALHLIDNKPMDMKRHAEANLKGVTAGLNDDQIRLASLMVDSDSRDYLQEHKPEEYEKATDDPAVMDAVKKFEPLWKELTNDRIALGWPIRRNLSVSDELPDGGFHVLDRDGSPVQTDEGEAKVFKTEKAAQKYVVQNGEPEPHLKRTYPEHSRSPLPAETGTGPYTGSYPHEKGLRPPKMDKKSREMSAEYHYQHGRKDFSGYVESYSQTKEAIAKQELFNEFTSKAEPWTAGTAQPSKIEYNGKTYYRPDIAMKAKQSVPGSGPRSGTKLEEYAVYDPTRGEKFMIANPEEGWATLSTGKPGIKASDRWLGPKEVVSALENYDKSRGGDASTIRKFFQEQIVGLFGPAVHVNNILRRVGQTAGLGTFDPRSWPSIARVIASPELRARVLKGVDDATIAMLSREGAWVDWNDIGNQNAYIGGNLNPGNWIRAFGKGVLFDPKFAKGWGGLDPKARVIVADYFKEHYPEMSDQQVAAAVNDGLGNYNRANWTARQRMLAKFTLFPGWDAGSVKWFLRKPFVVGVAGSLVVLAVNQALKAIGKNKGDDSTDMHYIHVGDRKYSTGLVTDNMGQHIMAPVLGAIQAKMRGEDVAAGATEEGKKGAAALGGTLAGPIVEMVADQLYNRKYAGSATDLVKPEDKYIPGTWAPNRELEKRIAFAALKGSPALNRFIDNEGRWDWAQGLGGAILGVTNYKYGAEERFKANLAKAATFGQTLNQLAEKDPRAASDFVKDPVRATYLMFHADLDQMGKDLKDIDTQIERVRGADIPASDREKALSDLKDNRNELLKAADGLNDALESQKSQARNNAASFWQSAIAQ